MNKYQQKLRLLLYTVFTFIAVVIIVDFVLPGRIINDKIINIKRERQQYNNAARNEHYSYKIITSEDQFSVTEDFAKLVKENEKIEYTVSPIFKEVNWYKLLSSENREFYSLRIMSGLVIPLLVIIAIFVSYLSIKNINILLFVLKILLILDLIYLMT